MRVIADLTLNLTLRQWAGLFNVLAILLFLATMLLSSSNAASTHDAICWRNRALEVFDV